MDIGAWTSDSEIIFYKYAKLNQKAPPPLPPPPPPELPPLKPPPLPESEEFLEAAMALAVVTALSTVRIVLLNVLSKLLKCP